MPISVTCTCGKKLSVKDELAGKRGKCPACGAMLSIPQPPKPAAIPAEPEEWGLAPLDDDPKPAKPATTSTKPAAAKTETAIAKPPVNGSTKSVPTQPAPALLADDFGLAPLDDEKPKPAPTAAKPMAKQVPAAAAKPPEKVAQPQAKAATKSAPADDDFLGLAPLDDDLFGKPSTSANPAPAARATPVVATKPAPAANAAKPPANGSVPTQAASSSSNTVPAKKALGGAAPALLDLPPLDEQGNLIAKSAASAAASSAKSPPAAAVQAKKAADGPAPLDLPALDGGEDHNHASWIDEGAETEFKLDGPALKAPAGTFSTPVTSTLARGHDEPEGEISCPRCGARLKRTLTVWTLPIRLLIGRMIVLFNGPIAMFKCKNCGPVHYEELNEPSRRAAGTGVQHLLKIMGLSFLILTTIGGLGFGLISMIKGDPHREAMERMQRENAERQKMHDEMNQRARERGPSRPMSQQEIEAMKKRSEEHRRETEERLKKLREQSTQPTRPNFPPSSSTPAAPNATPNPMPMQPKNPFEETTLPPTPAPKPMPVNPFEEVTPPPKPMPMPVNPFQPVD